MLVLRVPSLYPLTWVPMLGGSDNKDHGSWGVHRGIPLSRECAQKRQKTTLKTKTEISRQQARIT